MAARLQGEEDEHAAKLREKRRKMKELAEADARAKEAAEKLRGEERARAEAREEERREYERKKAEKKKNSFWSMGDSSSTSTTAQKTGTTAKRVPFNFEAVRDSFEGVWTPDKQLTLRSDMYRKSQRSHRLSLPHLCMPMASSTLYNVSTESKSPSPAIPKYKISSSSSRRPESLLFDTFTCVKSTRKENTLVC